MSVSYINPENHLAPTGKYSHAAVAEPGRFAFIAGQVAVDSDGVVVGKRDVGVQFRQAFLNLAAVIHGVGAEVTDVVDITTYLVGEQSLEPWRQSRETVYQDFFPHGRYPPNTVLVVSGLARENFKVEVSGVVRMPDNADIKIGKS